MKTIHYFNHSILDGKNGTLGPKGISLASFVGGVYGQENGTKYFEKVFVAPSQTASQTAMAFLLSYVENQRVAPQMMPIVFELGDDKLMNEVSSHSQFAVLASSVGKYQAVLDCYGSSSNVALSLRAQALAGVKLMFNAMDDDECVLAFGIDPMVSLAVSVVHQHFTLPEKYEHLSDMEGVILEESDGGFLFKVIDKIIIPASP